MLWVAQMVYPAAQILSLKRTAVGQLDDLCAKSRHVSLF